MNQRRPRPSGGEENARRATHPPGSTVRRGYAPRRGAGRLRVLSRGLPLDCHLPAREDAKASEVR